MSVSQSTHSQETSNMLDGRRIGRPARGVIVPLVTPLLGRDELDVDGLDRLTDHVLQGGVHGIFLLGTTGEAAALSGSVRRDLVARVCSHVQHRVPVIVGISDTSLVESLRQAEHAATVGAAAVVVTTPYYLPLETSELVKYVHEVNDESPLPVFLYNMPELARTWFSIEVLGRLLDLDNIVGLKDSSADTHYFAAAQALMSRRPDWSLLVGSDSLIGTAVRNGAHGGVTGAANVWPRLFVKMYDAALANDAATVAELQPQIENLANIYRYGGYGVGSIRGIKSALKSLSISNDRMAAPFAQVSDDEREAIENQLRHFGLLNGTAANGHSKMRVDEPSKPVRHYGSPATPRTPASTQSP